MIQLPDIFKQVTIQCYLCETQFILKPKGAGVLVDGEACPICHYLGTLRLISTDDVGEPASDLDAGIFYVRIEIDGVAKLTATSLCSICEAMVPTKAIDRHNKWHRDIKMNR